ncbi:hypothetical protein [Actinoplanes siamensis]|uniref:Uncharacterized protein n=1 Tax=Actinoplanes siamensis TaxID=1223317 RepID=A0A919TJ21_9ACTN|nr:hypothetical protein [Actinoplanes siamensis]GIF04462.1 hypothetical protein Asi03nite_20000 [Actinoplanes siamensis]
MPVLDGPGDEGHVLPGLGADARAGWDEAVARLNGTEVRFGAAPSAPRVFARGPDRPGRRPAARSAHAKRRQVGWEPSTTDSL